MREAGGGPSPTPPDSRIPPPDELPSRSATTVSSAPTAAPATAHGKPACQPADPWDGAATAAPHL